MMSFTCSRTSIHPSLDAQFTQAWDGIIVDWAAERGWWGVTRWEEKQNKEEENEEEEGGFDELLEFLALAGPSLKPHGLLSVGLGTGGAMALGLCDNSCVDTGAAAAVGECLSAEHSIRKLAHRLASACAAGGLTATAVVGDGSLVGQSIGPSSWECGGGGGGSGGCAAAEGGRGSGCGGEEGGLVRGAVQDSEVVLLAARSSEVLREALDSCLSAGGVNLNSSSTRRHHSKGGSRTHTMAHSMTPSMVLCEANWIRGCTDGGMGAAWLVWGDAATVRGPPMHNPPYSKVRGCDVLLEGKGCLRSYMTKR